MNKIASTLLLLSFITVAAAANAWEPTPDKCTTLKSGQNRGDLVCLFYINEGKKLVLFPNSIKSTTETTKDFQYIGPSGKKNWAQVECFGPRKHWHVFRPNGTSFIVKVTSSGAENMVGYICDY